MDSDSTSFQEDPDRSGDMVMSDNDIDPNYEPSEEEIIKYAIFLGIDPQKDREFLYVAREGLKAPVPQPWRACQTKSGEIYYFNFETGESQWDHPCDNIFRKKFNELKALSQGESHSKSEQKPYKQLQKRQQGSKSVQLIPTHVPDGFVFNEYSHRGDNREKDQFFSNTYNKYPRELFLYSGQLSINQESSDKEDSGVQIHESHAQSFEHIQDSNDNKEADQPKSSSGEEKQFERDDTIVHNESEMPETKNFYDDVSLNGENSVREDENNQEETSGVNSIQNIEGSAKKESQRSVVEKLVTEEGSANKNDWQNFASAQKGSEFINTDRDASASENLETNADRVSMENIDVNLNTEEEEILNLRQNLNWRPERDHNRHAPPSIVNKEHLIHEFHRGSASKKTNEEESVCFSDFKFTETEKKNKKKNDSAIVQELEDEFQELLQRYDEELSAKFSKILAEYEQDYQQEAAQISREYEDQVEHIRRELGHPYLQDKSNIPESDRPKLRESLIERSHKEFEEENQQMQQSFEAKKKGLESKEEADIRSILNSLQKSQDIQLQKAKQELQNAIDENGRAIQKMQLLSFRSEGHKNEKEIFEAKKKDTFSRIDSQFRELEKEQNKRLQIEMEGLKKELEIKLEYERSRLEEAFKLSQEEFKLLKSHIEETYRKNFAQEMEKMVKRQEKAIKELEQDEISRAEEMATQKVLAKCKAEHDKKMNTLQVERMLYDKQHKKRLEDIQAQTLKKHELEKMSFESQKNSEMKQLANQINALLNHILAKDSQLSNIEKYAKDIEAKEKEITEKNNATNQLQADITDLELKAKTSQLEIHQLETQLRDIQQQFSAKNHTLNELHQQLDKLELEINTTKDKMYAHQRSHQLDYSSNETFISQTSSNNLHRLLREVEGIKSAVRKRSVKKSVSVSRISGRNLSDINNKTMESIKRLSIMSNEKTPAYLEEVSGLVLDENLDKQTTFEKQKTMRKSQEIPRKNDQVNWSYYSMVGKKQKEPYMAPTLFNPLEAFQKPKNDWKAIIETERKSLIKHTQLINQKKSEARETHKQLKKEGEMYKTEHNALKNSANPTSAKKIQLEIFKKSLNDKIYDYNHRLCQIRDKESSFKLKEEALNKLERSYEESCMGLGVSQSYLNELYQEYRKLQIKSPETHKQAKSLERINVLKEKNTSLFSANNQGESSRINLNLAEMIKRNREAATKSLAIQKDEGSKENDQIRANALDAKEKLIDKVRNSVFQRKVLRKPASNSILSLKGYFDNSKSSQEYNPVNKK